MKKVPWPLIVIACIIIAIIIIGAGCSEKTTIIGPHGHEYKHYDCKHCGPDLCTDKHCWKHFKHDCRKGSCKK